MGSSLDLVNLVDKMQFFGGSVTLGFEAAAIRKHRRVC